jgi:hypothetical protein
MLLGLVAPESPGSLISSSRENQAVKAENIVQVCMSLECLCSMSLALGHDWGHRILTLKRRALLSIHSFKHASRKSMWFCISSSTVPTADTEPFWSFSMKLCQFGSMTSEIQKYKSCRIYTSMRARRVNARRFQSSIALLELW